jgi:hypothetical protein
MKAKYKHYGNECIIYDQVICEDNVVVTIRSYTSGWFDAKPETETKVCLTNAEARRLFHKICREHENEHYDCEYKCED